MYEHNNGKTTYGLTLTIHNIDNNTINNNNTYSINTIIIILPLFLSWRFVACEKSLRLSRQSQ